MFRNAGGKLGIILKILCYILMGGVFILGIIFAAEENAPLGLMIAFIGPGIIWLFSLYTIGKCDMMRDIYEIKCMMKKHPEFGKYLSNYYNADMNQNLYTGSNFSGADVSNNYYNGNINNQEVSTESVENNRAECCPKCGSKIKSGESFCGICGCVLKYQ